jgi:hypothetical protein
MKLSSADRKALVKLAASMPKGSAERRAILAGLKEAGGPRRMGRDEFDDAPGVARAIVKALGIPVNAIFVADGENNAGNVSKTKRSVKWSGREINIDAGAGDHWQVEAGTGPNGKTVALVGQYGLEMIYGPLDELQ